MRQIEPRDTYIDFDNAYFYDESGKTQPIPVDIAEIQIAETLSPERIESECYCCDTQTLQINLHTKDCELDVYSLQKVAQCDDGKMTFEFEQAIFRPVYKDNARRRHLSIYAKKRRTRKKNNNICKRIKRYIKEIAHYRFNDVVVYDSGENLGLSASTLSLKVN